MQTTANRTYTIIERVVCNPIGLLFIIGVIVVVVTILVGESPTTRR